MKVLVCDPIDMEGINILRREGFDVDFKPSITEDELLGTIGKYDVLLVRGRTKVTRQMLERGEQLKVIGRVGAGLDNIDLKASEERGITVLNTPEALADSVAELTFGLILAVSRRIAFADRAMKEGKWLKKELEGMLLKGKTLGIIGLGNIGWSVAKIGRSIGMKVLVTKRTPPKPELIVELGAEFVSLDNLLSSSDIVSIHVPLTPETRHLISSRELSLMKDEAILINTSRGGVVDEKALLEALKSGKLYGAALDVYETEPPTNLELVTLPNVVCTPHIGAQTKEAQKVASAMIAEKIARFFKNQ